MKFGKYEVIKEIGKGAMGVVYLAFDPVIERKVAIKTMNPQLFQDIEQRERFFREAKSAGNLHHQNIVTIYDMGMEGETPYIVMEYVEGEDLDALIKSKKIDTESALKIMSQLCDALSYAHSKGIIHRDIKPSNIRVLPDGTIKIMDFGIAKKTGSDLTQTGVLLGTISYMAPEQLKDGKVSPQSDQFSAGIVFYEMLTGEKCFKGDTITSIMYKIVSFDEKQLNMDNIPSSVASVLRRMVAPLPEKRYKSCNEVTKALNALASLTHQTIDVEKTVSVPPIPPVPQTSGVRKGDAEATQLFQKEEKKSSKLPKFLIAGFVLIAILSALLFFVGKKFVQKKAKPVVEQKIAEKVENNSEKNNEQSGNLVSENKEKIAENLSQDKKSEIEEEVEDGKKSDENEKSVSSSALSLKKNLNNGKKSLKKPLKKPKYVKKQPKQSQSVGEKAKGLESGEKEVFSYSNEVKKTESYLNFTESQKDALEKFKKETANLSFAERTALANNLFNAGMRALGNNSNRFAAVNFYKTILLNPQKKEAYSFLCVALARMRAYGDIKKVIKMANKQGFTLYELKQNRLFDAMYNRLKQKGFVD